MPSSLHCLALLAGRRYGVSVQNLGLLPCVRLNMNSSSLHLSRAEKRVSAHELRSNGKGLPSPNVRLQTVLALFTGRRYIVSGKICWAERDQGI